ncbi:MAG: hypothetical protein R3F49_23880 [Planctomycetota bacterium]
MIWLIGSLPLLAMLLAARPTRGENLTAAHLVTGPAALPPTLAAALFLWVVRDALGLAAWLGLACLPGYWVAMLALPLTATSPRHAWSSKAAGLLGFAAPAVLGNGAALGDWVPWLGFAAIVGLAAWVYGLAGPYVLRPVWQRLAPRLMRNLRAQERREGPPSNFERSQATWQRERWQHVTQSASVDELLPFVRAFAPEVKAASLERLAAHANLTESLERSIIRGGNSDPLNYLVHHYPRSRRELAPAMTARLEQVHGTWTEAARNTTKPPEVPEGLINLLDASIAVLRDGGELRPSLAKWKALLASRPDYRGVSKELTRLMS